MRSLAIARVLPIALVALVSGACAVSEPASPTPTSVASPSPSTLPATPTPSVAGAAPCAGRAVFDWTGFPSIARRYIEAWNEHNAAARLAMINEIWASYSMYIEPSGLSYTPLVGRTAFNTHIGLRQASADQYLEPRDWSEGDDHHGRLRLAWRLCGPAGPTGLEGTDYAEVSAGGRITLVVGFSPLTPANSGVDGGQAVEVCVGPTSFDWSALPEIVRLYAAAWNEPDKVKRDPILDRIWTEESVFVASHDDAPSVGRVEFEFGIDYGMGPGNYIEASAWSGVEMHNGWFHARWRDCCPDGTVLLEGTDVGKVDGSGRIERVTSFWREAVELPADAACG